MTGNWGQGGPLSQFQRLYPLRARDSAKSSMCQERILSPKSCAQTALALSLLFPTAPKYLASSRHVVPTQFPVTIVSLPLSLSFPHCVRMCICVYVCETNPNSAFMLHGILPSFFFAHKHSRLCETHPGLVFLVRQVLTVAYEHFRREALGDRGSEF